MGESILKGIFGDIKGEISSVALPIKDWEQKEEQVPPKSH